MTHTQSLVLIQNMKIESRVKSLHFNFPKDKTRKAEAGNRTLDPQTNTLPKETVVFTFDIFLKF